MTDRGVSVINAPSSSSSVYEIIIIGHGVCVFEVLKVKRSFGCMVVDSNQHATTWHKWNRLDRID
jgi:hypothetical protein